ncbi:MAG TPA: hypothetical protein ENN46_01670 [Candidatus Woesearchaeota archaeon]|nr:hypothetical protein [Candidatus Woesearchaeota archaeon]
MEIKLPWLKESIKLTRESRDIILMFLLVLTVMILFDSINPRQIETEYEIIDPECRISILDTFPVGTQNLVKIRIEGKEAIFFLPASSVKHFVYVNCEHGTVESY